MQPQTIHEEITRRKNAWDIFTSTGKILDDAGLNPLVAASWTRCGLRMNPTSHLNWTYASDNALQSTLKQHTSLRNIARPIMEDIYQFMEDCRVALILTDSSGCLLEVFGEPVFTLELQVMGYKPGAYLDEGHLATNAIAVTLFEAMPSQIVGPGHFYLSLHEFSSVAAPVHVDGIDRNIRSVFQDRIQDDIRRNEHVSLFQLFGKLIDSLDGDSNHQVKVLSCARFSPRPFSIAPPIRYSTLAAFSASITNLRKPAISNGFFVIGYTLSAMLYDLPP